MHLTPSASSLTLSAYPCLLVQFLFFLKPRKNSHAFSHIYDLLFVSFSPPFSQIRACCNRSRFLIVELRDDGLCRERQEHQRRAAMAHARAGVLLALKLGLTISFRGRWQFDQWHELGRFMEPINTIFSLFAMNQPKAQKKRTIQLPIGGL